MKPSPESPAGSADLLEAAEKVLAATSEEPGKADGFALHDALMDLGQAIKAERDRREGWK